jgi:hypothetical protein
VFIVFNNGMVPQLDGGRNVPMLPHDAATWALWIAIGTFVLTIPMGILAALATPKVQQWWAGRSRDSLIKRRDKLLGEQKELRDVPVIDPGADAVLSQFEAISRGLTTNTHLLFGAIIIVFACLEKVITHLAFALYGFSFLMLNNTVTGYFRTLGAMRQRRRISPDYRGKLAEEIARIEAKLAIM